MEQIPDRGSLDFPVVLWFFGSFSAHAPALFDSYSFPLLMTLFFFVLLQLQLCIRMNLILMSVAFLYNIPLSIFSLVGIRPLLLLLLFLSPLHILPIKLLFSTLLSLLVRLRLIYLLLLLLIILILKEHHFYEKI